MNKNEIKYFNTAQKMDDALIILLEKKPFEFITIKDICNEANVNRSTFYLHYESILDLLEEVIENSNEAFSNYFNEPHEFNFLSDSNEDLILINDKYLIPYLNFIKDNKKIYQAAKNNLKLFNVDVYSSRVYSTIINKIFDRFNINNEHREYIFSFYISGINSLVLKWCSNDCDLEVQEIANMIKDLILKW